MIKYYNILCDGKWYTQAAPSASGAISRFYKKNPGCAISEMKVEDSSPWGKSRIHWKGEEIPPPPRPATPVVTKETVCEFGFSGSYDGV